MSPPQVKPGTMANKWWPHWRCAGASKGLAVAVPRTWFVVLGDPLCSFVPHKQYGSRLERSWSRPVEPSRGGGTGGEWLTEMRYLFTVCHSLGPMGLDDGARWLTWAYVVLRWLTNGLRHWCFIRTKRKQCVVGGPRREAKTSVGTGVAWLIRVEKMFCSPIVTRGQVSRDYEKCNRHCGAHQCHQCPPVPTYMVTTLVNLANLSKCLKCLQCLQCLMLTNLTSASTCINHSRAQSQHP